MAQTMTAMSHVVFNIPSISFLLMLVWGGITCIDARKPNGLSMELIHIFSPASPLYPGNISYEEEIERLVTRSNGRAQYLHATIASASNNNHNNMSQVDMNGMILPRLEFYPYGTYLVQVGIGTFDATFPARSFKSYYLYIDTGSNLLWTHCEDCRKPGNQCFQTREPPFPNSESKTYWPLPCDGLIRHPLCTPGQCVGDYCSQDVQYEDGSAVRSILAGETFNFYSSSGGPEQVEGLVFGCAYDVRNMRFGKLEEYKVAGLLGLANAPTSFPMQVSPLIQGVFSYCLTRRRDVQTNLRFGADIPTPPDNVRVTKLVLLQNIPYYYVNLRGISVNGATLQINPSVFDIRNQGREGGCVLDNGSSFTYLITPAFDTLVQFLGAYFSPFGVVKTPGPPALKLSLCYKWTPRLARAELPTLTFHFENADLDIKPEDAFMKFVGGGNDALCLAINSHPVRTIFGSFQQANYRFIYDLNGGVLKFSPEDCSKNS